MESIATPDNAHGKETYCHCEDESIGRYVASGQLETFPALSRMSAVRGRADLQTKKADIAARRSALGGMLGVTQPP